MLQLMKRILVTFVLLIGVAGFILFLLIFVFDGWTRTTYEDKNIRITFIPFRHPGLTREKISGIPYRLMSCKSPEYSYEDDGVIPADFFSLKIFNYAKNWSELVPLGFIDDVSKIKPEVIVNRILLPLENYKILNFKVIEHKTISKDSFKGTYIKAKLNREGRGEFLTEAIIYHNPAHNQFYVLSTYHEERSQSVDKESVKFFNSFRIK